MAVNKFVAASGSLNLKSHGTFNILFVFRIFCMRRNSRKTLSNKHQKKYLWGKLKQIL